MSTTVDLEPLTAGAVEAARLIGIGRTALLEGVAAGRIPPPLRIGRRLLWRVDELRKWIAAGAPPVVKWEYREGV